jgi:pyrroline-5-carboxylate reductase
MNNIGFIGFGNMGEAIAQALQEEASQEGAAGGTAPQLGIIDKKEDRAALASSRYSARVFSSYKELFDFAEITILAVKPQDLVSLFEKAETAGKDSRIISIAAGVPITMIAEGLQSDKIVRFMPNLAASIRESAVGVSCGNAVDEQFRRDALTIASLLGTPYELPEKLLSAFTGLSGSGIAYVFSFIHALALGGTKTGIPYPTSLEIALDTVRGAAAVLKASGENPISMLSKVVSPGGTTIEGVTALERGKVTASVIEAVEAASIRAEEIEAALAQKNKSR